MNANFACGLVLIAVVITGSNLSAQDRQPLEEIVRTEKAFAEAAVLKGVRQAFLEFLDDDGILFQPTAVNGKQAWNARAESPALLAWNPVWADVAVDGSIGYTTGDWDFRPAGKEDSPIAFGQYLTIWKKSGTGQFKAVLDIGVVHPQPERLTTEWDSPKFTVDPGKVNESVGQPELKSLNLAEYEQQLADEVRLYRDQKMPMLGKQAALEQIQTEQAGIEAVRILNPKCFRTADFAYGYATLELTKRDGATTRENLLRIWKLRNGKWEITVDLTSPIPPMPK